jgi:hypothetical protein
LQKQPVFKRRERVPICWRWLLVCGKVESDPCTCWTQVLAAWLAVGTGPGALAKGGERRSALAEHAGAGDEVGVGLLLAGASVADTTRQLFTFESLRG